MNTNTNTNAAATFTRPGLTLYHANAKGTGCALRLELRPAEVGADGYILMSLAPQMTVGNRVGPNPTFPTFDWENRIKAKICFTELSKMLQVFRGECETLEGDKGIYIRTTEGQTRVMLRHFVEPFCGYSLEVMHSPCGGDDRRANFVMTSAEALGVCEAFVGSMYLVAFGVPNAVR